jgi:hypothetical protein
MMMKKKDVETTAEERRIKRYLEFDNYDEYQKVHGSDYNAWKFYYHEFKKYFKKVEEKS